jgi:mercuric ion transport protein
MEINNNKTRDKTIKKENISSIMAVIISFLAASCCIGPAIFIIFGVSAGFMGNFGVLEVYKPYFLVAGFIMLSFSFWKLYIKNSSCDCKEDIRLQKISRGIFWFGTIMFVFALSFQKILIWIY